MVLYFGDVFTECEDINTWSALYSWLFPKVKSWVCESGILSWDGQVYDVAADITQETVFRVFLYSQRIAKEEAAPIRSLKHFSLTVAYHYYSDLKRKERRFVLFTQLDPSGDSLDKLFPEDVSNSVEELLNTLYLEEVCVELARIIINMPVKQRSALLTALAMDLPKYPSPEIEATPLQRALSDLGIQLQDYQRTFSDDARIRTQYAANLSLARKRILNTYKSDSICASDERSSSCPYTSGSVDRIK